LDLPKRNYEMQRKSEQAEPGPSIRMDIRSGDRTSIALASSVPD